MAVDSTLFQSGRSHEIGKCSAVVSFLIKDWRCLTNDLLPSLLALAHVPAPNNPNPAIILPLTARHKWFDETDQSRVAFDMRPVSGSSHFEPLGPGSANTL
jgi:hypothetical protein